MDGRWSASERTLALLMLIWLASLGLGADGCTARDCEGATRLLESAGDTLNAPTGVVGGVASPDGEPLQVRWSASAGRDGRFLSNNWDRLCPALLRAFFVRDCAEVPHGEYALGYSKLSEENVLFGISSGLLNNTGQGCIDRSALEDDGLPKDYLRGWNTILINSGSPTLGETMPYRFVEQVRNRDLCPAVDCATLEPFDVPCHKVRLTSGLVIDGEPVFAEGTHLLPAIPLWDYERPQLALPDLVPGVRTDVEFAETLVTECAYAHSRAVEAGLAPRIMGIRIRFPSAFANLGHGPLEVRPPGGIVPDEGDVWAVEQVLYEYQDAETTWPIAGDATLDFHPSHWS